MKNKKETIIQKDTIRFQVTPDKTGLSMRNSSHLAAILGQKGVKPMEFFKLFNETIVPRVTFLPNIEINVVICVLTNDKRKKSIQIKSASVAGSAGKLLKKLAKDNIITMDQIKELAKRKIHDFNCYAGDLKAATKILIGSAMAANLKITGEL